MLNGDHLTFSVRVEVGNVERRSELLVYRVSGPGLPLLGHLNRVSPDIDQLLDSVAQLNLVCQMVKHKEGDCVKVVLKP